MAPVWHVNDANFMLTSLLTRADVTRTSCVSSTVVIIPYLRSHLKTEIAYPVRHHLFKRDRYAGFDLPRENADKLYRVSIRLKFFSGNAVSVALFLRFE